MFNKRYSDNPAIQATDDNILVIRRMRFASWMTKTTDTHS